MKTNHLQNGSRPIYCHKLGQVLDFLSQKHLTGECYDCPYFAGTYQGTGIECKYSDGTNEPVEVVSDAQVLANRMSLADRLHALKQLFKEQA